jgi:carbon storage regulator CsrA
VLVMRRRAGESLLIGEVEIRILEVGPTRVRLGIIAPEALAIIRKEVALTREANLAASRTAPSETIVWLSRKLGSRPGNTSC